MPLIEISGPAAALGAGPPQDVLRVVNRAVADALGSPRQDVAWSTWTPVEATAVGYEEQPLGPVIVHVYARRTADEWNATVAAIDETLSALIDPGAGVLITTHPFRHEP